MSKQGEKTKRPKHGDLRVWWIPQVPMVKFTVDVPDLASARLVLNTLADYDNFQFENRIKPDYCNAGGLQAYWRREGWCDWNSEDGDDFDDVPTEALATVKWNGETA